jgi:hypothetical protein
MSLNETELIEFFQFHPHIKYLEENHIKSVQKLCSETSINKCAQILKIPYATVRKIIVLRDNEFKFNELEKDIFIDYLNGTLNKKQLSEKYKISYFKLGKVIQKMKDLRKD